MSHILEKTWLLCVVADGLGGHRGGELASRYFCESLISSAPDFAPNIPGSPQETMASWIHAAINKMAERLIGADAGRAHTTCAILWVNDELVVSAHMGDSRTYRLDPERIVWRSRDHSVTQMLFDEGEITEDEMGTHPDQNRLVRSISASKKHKPTIKVYPAIKAGETFILCTDGFWAFSTPSELLQLAQFEVTEHDIVDQAMQSIERAKGNSDNVTIQWLRVL